MVSGWWRGFDPSIGPDAEHLSFLHNPKYVAQAAESRAGAILVHSADRAAGRDLLVCAQPYLAVARALEIFHPRRPTEPGVHPSAVVGR